MIRRVAVGIGMTAFDKLVIAGTQLALVPILATRWGLELYGQWLILAALPQFLSMSDLGFATAAGTRMTMAVACGERDDALRLFQSAWRATLASSAAILGLLLLAVWLMPAGVLGEDPAVPVPQLRLTLAILVVYGVTAVQGSILFAAFRAAQLFPVGAFCNAMVLLIENAALLATVIAGGDMVAAALAWLCGRLVGLAGQALLLRRRVPWLTFGLARGSWTQARTLLAPAASVLLLPLAQALVLQGSALIVGAAAGPAAVPVFVAVRTLSRVGLQMCWIVTTPLMPEVSAALARGDRQRMAAMLLAVLLFSMLLVAPYALGFALLGGPAVSAWTHGAIVPPAPLVAAMALTILFGGLWYPVSNLILACDRQADYTRWYGALAIVCLPACHVSCIASGVSGAGYALAVLDLAMLLVIVRLARRTLATPAELRDAARSCFVRARLAIGSRRISVRPAR